MKPSKHGSSERLEPFPEISLERLRQGPVLAPGPGDRLVGSASSLRHPERSSCSPKRRRIAGASKRCPTYGPNVERPAAGEAERLSAPAPHPQHQEPDPLAVRQSPFDPRARPGYLCRDEPGRRRRPAASTTATRCDVFNDRGSVRDRGRASITACGRDASSSTTAGGCPRAAASTCCRPPARPTWATAPRFTTTPSRWSARDESRRSSSSTSTAAPGVRPASIACNTENEVAEGLSWRRIHTFNQQRLATAPVFHFTLACNHCLEPACLHNCPANAYTKDPSTGAVLIDQDLCIGCRYCAWVCPYEAPRYNSAIGVDGEVHLLRASAGGRPSPACVTACPTEALRFERDKRPGVGSASWFSRDRAASGGSGRRQSSA